MIEKKFLVELDCGQDGSVWRLVSSFDMSDIFGRMDG